MTKLAFLGPAGTWSETAALAYGEHHPELTLEFCPQNTIYQVLESIATQKCQLGIVPIENSIQGSVTTTLDGLWQRDQLQIQEALVLPIRHALISCAPEISQIKAIYSHPQALSQCQQWLEQNLPLVPRVSTHSTTDSLLEVAKNPRIGAIASLRAAHIHNLPILASPINDYQDNCTCFWVLAATPNPQPGERTSLAFSVLDRPGSLVKPLLLLADRGINLTRIESRPSKRSLGEYIFFADIDASTASPIVKRTLEELTQVTETLKIFGSYNTIYVNQDNFLGSSTKGVGRS